jgi:hypothetical protein
MTLGCGSWGGNVTSDNVSPLHLMDIKRVAFETRPVKSARPAVGVQATASATQAQPATAAPAIAGGKIDRQEIAAIVDRFLAGKRIETPAVSSPLPKPEPEIEAEAGSMYAAPVAPPPKIVEPVSKPAAPASSNGNKAAVDFVSEDDVRRAIQKGDKIYINAKTIITPAARDMGEPAEVFAKV